MLNNKSWYHYFLFSSTIFDSASLFFVQQPIGPLQRVEFLRGRSNFGFVSNVRVDFIKLNFEVFGQFWWFWWSGLGFLSWNGAEIMPKYGLELVFWIFWEAMICAITFLLVNDVFKTNYSKRFRWPPIDLRRGVHLKHQNLISKFEQKSIKTNVEFQMILLCVYPTSFKKCFTTH